MANFVAHQQFNMASMGTWTGNVEIASSSHIEIKNEGFEQHYYGSFIYDEFGLAGGTLCSTEFYLNNVLQYSVENIDTSALSAEYYINSGSIQGLINLIAGNSDSFIGSSYGDMFLSTPGSDVYNGKEGLDTIKYRESLSSISIDTSGDGFVVTTLMSGIDRVENIERLEFLDMGIALDFEGSAGYAYRLYQAAFDRMPDSSGIGYWINRMDSGSTLEEVSDCFIHSQEFRGLYGDSPCAGEFVRHLYDNVLHREPDVSGYEYWVSQIEDEGMSNAEVLLRFADSQENRISVFGAMEDGIEYVPFVA